MIEIYPIPQKAKENLFDFNNYPKTGIYKNNDDGWLYLVLKNAAFVIGLTKDQFEELQELFKFKEPEEPKEPKNLKPLEQEKQIPQELFLKTIAILTADKNKQKDLI